MVRNALLVVACLALTVVPQCFASGISGGGLLFSKSIYNTSTGCVSFGPLANANGMGEVADQASHRITGNLVIEAWIRPTAYSTSKATITIRDDGTAAALPWFFYLNSDGRLAMEVYGGTGSATVYSTNIIPLGTWTHVAVRHRTSDDTYTFLINGVASGGDQSATVVGPTSTGMTTQIGTWTGGKAQYQFCGDIADLAIFNTALTDTQILAHVTTPVAAGETGLVSLYKFNEGSGTAFADTAGGTAGVLSGRVGWNKRNALTL